MAIDPSVKKVIDTATEAWQVGALNGQGDTELQLALGGLGTMIENHQIEPDVSIHDVCICLVAMMGTWRTMTKDLYLEIKAEFNASWENSDRIWPATTPDGIRQYAYFIGLSMELHDDHSYCHLFTDIDPSIWLYDFCIGLYRLVDSRGISPDCDFELTLKSGLEYAKQVDKHTPEKYPVDALMNLRQKWQEYRNAWLHGKEVNGG